MKLDAYCKISPWAKLSTKTLTIMKLTAVLLVVALLQVNARGLTQNITLSEKNVPLEKVFKSIEKQSGYLFWYKNDLFKEARKVNISVKNASIEEVLQLCFKDQSFEYSIVDRIIAIKAKAEKQPGTELAIPFLPIKGIVSSSENNQPLAGASVRIKGKSYMTMTDENGQFELNASPGDVLIISYTGFQTTETAVVAGTPLKITLQLIMRNLDIITVSTGYQEIAKERSAGSFAKPDLEIMRNRSGSMNILQRLDGLVPGLTVNNAPLSNNPILIRGLTTIGLEDKPGSFTGTNRSPLYVIDGIAIENVSTINPQDIADITVLKDATAASIWGARASNGVIVMTTKRGSHQEKIKVQYDAFVNFQGRPDLDYTPVLTSEQYIQTVKEIYPDEYFTLNPWGPATAYTNTGGTGLSPHMVILYNKFRGIITAQQADKSLDSLAAINNHSQIRDLFYRNASLMNHTVSLSGGGRVHSFYGSLSYTNTTSPRPGERNNSYKVNVRQDLNLSKWLKAYVITDLTNSILSSRRQPAIDYRFYPYQLFQDANGNNLSVPYVGYVNDSIRKDWEERSRVNLDYVPLDEVNYGYTKTNALLGRVTGGVKISLLKGLNFEGVYGFVKGSNRTTSYDDEKSYPVRTELVQFTVAPDAVTDPFNYLPASGGKYSVTNINLQNWTIRNQFTYENSWNNRRHQVTLMAGQEAQDQLTIANNSQVRGYNEKLQTFIAVDYAMLGTTGLSNPVMTNATGKSILSEKPFSQAETEIRFTSYYTNAAYTYNRKYTVNGSWRIDHSNLFGLDKSAQNKPVWSAGVKWRISEEDFMKNADWLNVFSVRATYGITGNSPLPGTSSSYDILAPQSNASLPGGLGLRIATASNPKLTWESTQTVNIGFDFSVLNSRLNGSIDFYNKNTDNLLGNMIVNGFTGFPAIVGNFGSLQNKGVEFSINSLNIRGRNFSWYSLLSLAYNKNVITQLNDPTAITTGAQKIASEYVSGYSAFSIFAYKHAGLDNLGDPQILLNDKTVTKARNVATPEDIVFMGTYQPVWSGGLTNSFRYKNFTLTANMVFNLGHVMRRDVGPNYFRYSTNFTSHGNVMGMSDQSGLTGGQLHPDFLNRWKKPGDEATTNVPSYVVNSSVSDTRRDLSYYRYGDINVVSASFIKLRDITLEYSLPENLLSRIKTENITLRVQVSNIMLWKANKYGIDPEFQDPFNGRRAPSVPYTASDRPDINTQSYRFGQGTISVGAHVNF